MQPKHKRYQTSLLGEHQQWNAALAVKVAAHLKIASIYIRQGIANVQLPARIETVQNFPRVIIDGAHDTLKIKALFQVIKKIPSWQKLHLIFAAKEGKSPQELLAPLAPLVNSAYLTSFQLPGFSSVSPQTAATALKKLNKNVKTTIETNAHYALKQCLQNANKKDLVLITGSLYLCGELRPCWFPEEKIIMQRSSFPQ